jgi:di/tricarboxylate transporter
MFTSVQYHPQKANLEAKKGALKAGMALAKGERMIKRFTYKELTIIIGIIVALVIVFAFWSNSNVSGESLSPSIKPKVETSSINNFAKRVMTQILTIVVR